MFKKKVIAMGLLISFCLSATACSSNKEAVETVGGNSISTVVDAAVDAAEDALENATVESESTDTDGNFIEDVVNGVSDMVDTLVESAEAIDKGVSNAIIGYYDGIFAEGDAFGEGHVVLGYDKDADTGNVLVYALTSYAEYEMDGDSLVRADGSDVVPSLITLDGETFDVISFEMLDESSINELVPEEHREAMLNNDTYVQVLTDMEMESAKNNPSDGDVEVEVITPVDTNTDEVLTDVFTSVREGLGMDYFPNMEITPDLLEMVYGITSDMYDAVYGEMPMVSANVDVLLGVKASEGMKVHVEDALNNYVKTLKEDTMQYPSNLAKIPATTVVSRGDYVFVVATFGDTTAVEPDGDEAILKVAQANVDKTIEIINSIISE